MLETLLSFNTSFSKKGSLVDPTFFISFDSIFKPTKNFSAPTATKERNQIEWKPVFFLNQLSQIRLILPKVVISPWWFSEIWTSRR